MPIRDPRGGFFYPSLKLMMDSYNEQQQNHCLRNGQQSRTLRSVGEGVLNYILLAKMYVLDSAILLKHKHCLACIEAS